MRTTPSCDPAVHRSGRLLPSLLDYALPENTGALVQPKLPDLSGKCRSNPHLLKGKSSRIATSVSILPESSKSTRQPYPHKIFSPWNAALSEPHVESSLLYFFNFSNRIWEYL